MRDKSRSQKAAQLISRARSYWEDRSGFRQFKLQYSSMVWNAEHYLDFYDWKSLPQSEYGSPPLLKPYSNDQLMSHAEGKIVLKLPDLPVHSQAVERWVQDTAKVAATQIGHKKRHASLLNLENNRQSFPTDTRKALFM